MVKNRRKNYLGHLVDFLIFFKNKKFSSIFRLEIWWDIPKHQIAPVVQLRWVGWLAEKWLEPQKTKIFGYFPLLTAPNFFKTFCDHHRKDKVLADIFYVESLFPTCLVWALWLFELTQLVFLAFKKTFFLKRRHNDVKGARNLPQKMRCCLPDPMMSSLIL